MEGPNTRFLLDSGSTLQNNTSYSTPEAETVAGAIGLTRRAWPLRQMLEDIWGRLVEMHAYPDNSTALHDLLTGQLKDMRHLRKQHYIIISLINEAMARPGCNPSHVESGSNAVDIEVKLLGPEKNAYPSRGLTLSGDVCSLVLILDGVVAAAAFFKKCTKLELHGEDLEQGLGDFLLFALGAVVNGIVDVSEL